MSACSGEILDAADMNRRRVGKIEMYEVVETNRRLSHVETRNSVTARPKRHCNLGTYSAPNSSHSIVLLAHPFPPSPHQV
jgi:hypothetical protein